MPCRPGPRGCIAAASTGLGPGPDTPLPPVHVESFKKVGAVGDRRGENVIPLAVPLPWTHHPHHVSRCRYKSHQVVEKGPPSVRMAAISARVHPPTKTMRVWPALRSRGDGKETRPFVLAFRRVPVTCMHQMAFIPGVRTTRQAGGQYERVLLTGDFTGLGSLDVLL